MLSSRALRKLLRIEQINATQGRWSVMTLRTPRRRISPRTKRRYRIIRNFFKRALGTSSQPDIKISSSIAVDVSDIKHKIIGLERQLNDVNKHCSELACFENTPKNSESLVQSELRYNIGNNKEQNKRTPNETETKVLYKTSESNYRNFEDSDHRNKSYNDAIGSQHNRSSAKFLEAPGSKVKKKKDYTIGYKSNYNKPSSQKNKIKSFSENFVSPYSTSSFHSLVNPNMTHYLNAGCSNHYYDRKNIIQAYPDMQCYDKKYKEPIKKYIYEEKHVRSRKHKRDNRDLDQGFIADIIKKQYKPVKMFGRRESDISQFSAPVCRDQEFSLRENILEDPELCSCCFEGQRRVKHTKRKDLCDMRSICDTRLYSSKKSSRPKHRRRHAETYNDSDLYDLIPVKEKSSPKSRRKFIEDNMVAYNYYKEVPPSPRTLRPRLNLQSQYYDEFEDYVAKVKHRNKRTSPSRLRRYMDCGGSFESDIISGIVPNRNSRLRQNIINENKTHVPNMQHETGTMSSFQYPSFDHEKNLNVDSTLNKTQETDLSVDKTDKALCEIKDILQCFLLEIKKETTASQCDKSDVTSKAVDNGVSNNQHTSTNINSSMLPNSGHSFNNYGMAQCSMPPFIPSFQNPCCYPILPMCPMNCVQNGYIVPSPSFTCAACANTKDSAQNKKPSTSSNNAANEICNPETEQLIKEIYKYVAQSPKAKKNEQCDIDSKYKEAKILTSRSAGGSTMTSKHDAKVGTPKMKCYSKSCEAIGSKIVSDAYYSGTNATHSDTILERLSLEATPSDSVSETDFTHTSTSIAKGTGNRFAKVLRSFGLLKKKKKKDVIEELSESESTIEVDIQPKPPPFRQNITNYMMHDQEYYQPPTVPPLTHPYQQRPPDYHEYRQPYNPNIPEYSQNFNDSYNRHRVHQQTIQEYSAPYYPTAPPHANSFERYHNQSQVPLCLKEIEVKSIGTQSERKMSFFRKMKTKMQPPGQTTVHSDEYPHINCSTQTAQDKPALFSLKNLQNKSLNKTEQGMFSFKSLQNKSANKQEQGLFGMKNLQNKSMNNTDPMTFSYWKQKQLAEGDLKMRNVMLKKLFYKRNPFSPRNLIVRTLLGKDKSSFGEPPTMYKARMFL